MDELIIRVASLDDVFATARAAARRIDAGDRTPQPAELTFETMEQMMATLTAGRWILMAALGERGASSPVVLAQAVGRLLAEVQADLDALKTLDLVEERPDGSVRVPWRRITTELSLSRAA